MKTLRSLLVVLAISAAAVSTASARDSFNIGINIGGYNHGYHAPPPVRYYSAPPVVYGPQVYYAAPRVVYARPYYYAQPRASFNYHYYDNGHRHFDNRGGDNRWNRHNHRGDDRRGHR